MTSIDATSSIHMWNLRTQHFENLLLLQFIRKISAMFSDCKEIFVIKKINKPKQKPETSNL